MTQKRRDNTSTEFGLWLREQQEIDSGLGYVTTNIDYVWRNYKKNLFMLIEEKRYGYLPKFYQMLTYKAIDIPLRVIPAYKGFHVLVFEKTNPDDGGIWLDGKFITKDDLIEWLTFESDQEWYKSYFPNNKIVSINFDAKEGR